MDAFQSYVQEKHPAALAEIEVVQVLARDNKLQKKEFFLQEGERCQMLGFILEGATRHFFTDEKGLEHCIQLSVEGWWISDREAVISNSPSRINIQAVEPCKLLVWDLHALENIQQQAPEFHRMMQNLKDVNAVSNQNRLVQSLSHSAEQRYAHLMEKYPEFILRFPQRYIASYLGISPETLSRIRKKMV